MASSPPKTQVPALSRAVAILDYIGRKPGSSFTAIHTELGLPKSSTYMLLKTLVELGLLRLSSGSQYTLGLRLYELGGLAVRHLDVRKEALPLMKELTQEVQLTSHLGILDGTEGVYLAKVDCDQALIVNSWEGKRVSLNASSLGKALLLSASHDMYNKLIDSIHFHDDPGKAANGRDAFIREIEEARSKGWTVDDEEDVPGLRCVGTPIYGLNGPPLSLSVAGPATQVPYHRMEELAARLMDVSKQLSRNLGVR